MRGVELVQPYLQAAKDVIARETGSEVAVGKVSLKKPPARFPAAPNKNGSAVNNPISRSLKPAPFIRYTGNQPK